MPRRFWKIFSYSGLLLFLLLGSSLYTQLELPKTTGPYVVGGTIFRWEDASRPEVLTEHESDFREVMALIWYPAKPNTGQRAGYIPDLATISDSLAQSGELAWWDVLGLRFVRSGYRLDAIPLKENAPYPVILLSPGNGTNIEFYSNLAPEIASYGYIVVGINHPYDVPAVELSDGRVAPYDKAQWSLDAAAHQAYTGARMNVRTADLLFALNQLEILGSNTDSFFAGILDLESVAAAGHSLGGIAASEACKADPRFRACMNFDGLQKGGPFSMDETAVPPAQPFLFLTKEAELHSMLLERFESTPESYWVTVHGAAHDSFTDGPQLQPALLPLPNQADQMMNIIQRYTLAFLDRTLKGKSNTLLSSSIEGGLVDVRVFPSSD